MRSEKGITIIETTVILSVMFILAGVMSPIVAESVSTARAVKAKNDAGMIAMGLINLQKDVGADALTIGGAALAMAAADAIRMPAVLASAGNVPSTNDRDEGEPSPDTLALLSRPGGGNARGQGSANMPAASRRRHWVDAPAEGLDDHLISNRRGYRYRRPGEYGGWNGPYVSGDVKGDPWGNQYRINTQFLDGGSTAADSDGNPRRAVYVVSAGADGTIQTPFEQPINDARAYGDDIVVRIQ